MVDCTTCLFKMRSTIFWHVFLTGQISIRFPPRLSAGKLRISKKTNKRDFLRRISQRSKVQVNIDRLFLYLKRKHNHIVLKYTNGGYKVPLIRGTSSQSWDGGSSCDECYRFRCLAQVFNHFFDTWTFIVDNITTLQH